MDQNNFNTGANPQNVSYAPQPAPTPAPAPEKPKSKAPIIIAVIVVLIIAAIVAVVLLLPKDDKGNTDNNNQPNNSNTNSDSNGGGGSEVVKEPEYTYYYTTTDKYVHKNETLDDLKGKGVKLYETPEEAMDGFGPVCLKIGFDSEGMTQKTYVGFKHGDNYYYIESYRDDMFEKNKEILLSAVDKNGCEITEVNITCGEENGKKYMYYYFDNNGEIAIYELDSTGYSWGGRKASCRAANYDPYSHSTRSYCFVDE